MAEQKPAGVSWESWTESLIRQAQAEGRFSNLPGEGAPLRAVDAPYDELWWARSLLERERISFLPTALRLRGEVERALERVMAMDTETAVRTRIDSLNERIRSVNATTYEGPPTTVAPLDAERIVARWRSVREAAADHGAAEPATAPGPGAAALPRASLFLAACLALAVITAVAWWEWGL